MSSIHKVGLFIAGLATVLAVAGAFVVQGYTTARQAAAAPPAVADVAVPTVTPSPDPTATPTLPPQIVYVEPVPSPAVIHVTRPAKPATTTGTPASTPAGPQPTPPVIHVVVPTPTGGDDGGGDD